MSTQETISHEVSAGDAVIQINKDKKILSGRIVIEVSQDAAVDAAGIDITIQHGITPNSSYDIDYIDNDGVTQTLGYTFQTSTTESELLITDQAFGLNIYANIDVSTAGATTGTIYFNITEYSG